MIGQETCENQKFVVRVFFTKDFSVIFEEINQSCIVESISDRDDQDIRNGQKALISLNLFFGGNSH